jgi:CheY-like chemotaxis protein
VLIVDDDPEVRRLLKRLLADVVDDFDECGTGTDAVAAFAGCRPDVVLMDVQLPGLDGISATHEIVALQPTAVVVVVSNHDGAALRRRAQEAGAAAYVLKDNLMELKQLLLARFGKTGL